MKFGFNTPFAEQLDFFRQKLNLPSERWDDIRKAAHDRAFIVAGAMKADLVADLRESIDKAIELGTGLEEFRRDFSKIVQKHGWTGWTGEGSAAGEAWRTRVIYQTNMATSYAAGRYRQLTDPDFVALFPFWRYVHNDGVMHPRPLHQHWGAIRLTLRHDHPFWQTHFPPNGWGCQCRVTPIDAPADGDATEPPEGWNVRDSKGSIPGIDKGFDYAPGASATKPLREFIDEKLIRLDAPIGAVMWQELKPALASETAERWQQWLVDVLADPTKRGRLQVVGALDQDTLTWLAEERSLRPATCEIAVQDGLIVGKKAERHGVAGDALAESDWRRLPEIVSEPERVLFDNRSGKLVFVGASFDARKIKLALEFDFRTKKANGETNLIVSAFKIPTQAIDGEIKGGFYTVVGK